MTFEDLDELEPEPVKRDRPPLRQPVAETSQKVTRSESWWMTVPDRAGFTARAEAERERMSSDREGRKVPDSINGKWIKGVGVW